MSCFVFLLGFVSGAGTRDALVDVPLSSPIRLVLFFLFGFLSGAGTRDALVDVPLPSPICLVLFLAFCLALARAMR